MGKIKKYIENMFSFVKYFIKILHFLLLNALVKSLKYPGVKISPSVEWFGNGTVEIAPNASLGDKVKIRVKTDAILIIERNVKILDNVEINVEKYVEIGESTSLQNRTQIHGDVTIGSCVVGAPNLFISSGEHVFKVQPEIPIKIQDRISEINSSPVKVGDDCWLGINVVIMPGVEIGRGCVIGANAVVTSNIPPYSVAVGVPARVIKQRMEFIIPEKLDAQNDSSFPYFYEGFNYLSKGAGDRISRINGGLIAREKFGIACNAKSDGMVSIRVYSNNEIYILHGDDKFKVVAGLSEIHFRAIFDARGVLCFRKQFIKKIDNLLLIFSVN